MENKFQKVKTSRLRRLILSVVFLSNFVNISAAFTSDQGIPGEPLNPDEFDAGRKYQRDVEAGLIQEPTLDSCIDVAPKNSYKNGIWNRGVVPYHIAGNFDPHERTVISSAIAEYQPKTCLVFSPRTTEQDYINIIRGNKGSGCYSMVGKMGGQQALQVGPDCMKRGSIVHELLHAAGFTHEHQRVDREEYIEIHYEYIKENLKNQFSILNETHNTLTGYDYGSILHYSERANCINPCPNRVVTISKKKGNATEIGQRNGLSTLDIERTNLLYNCSRPNNTITDAAGGAQSSIFSMWPIIGGQRQLRGCHDFDERCSFIRSQDCKQNSTWINFTCRKTCGQCQENSDCSDFNRKCSFWARKGKCEEQPEYMLTYCQKSCRTCSV